MDADQFDTLTRSVTASGSRRRALFAALGGTLGLLGLDSTEAKKHCPPCKQLKNGKCKKKRPDGTKCGPCRTCEHGKCTGEAATNTTCQGDGKCYAGECAARPTCLANAALCPAATPCCG